MVFEEQPPALPGSANHNKHEQQTAVQCYCAGQDITGYKFSVLRTLLCLYIWPLGGAARVEEKGSHTR